MALITIDEVQVWLEATKLRLGPDDELPEESTASELVRSRLASKYTVTDWTTPATTPTLIRKIIAMLVAAWRYNKHYSETADAGNPYADKLELIAMDMISGIEDGSIALVDVTDEGPAVVGTVSFYPTDLDPLNEYDEPDVKFTMGSIF